MSHRTRVIVALLLIAALPAWSLAQRGGKGKAKRVAPPQFDEAKTNEYFFKDVFAILVGERPDLNKPGRGTRPSTPGGPDEPATVLSGGKSSRL